jgi:hypothetical protein
MISAQSRLLRSNGSKLLVFALLSLAVTSCALFRKAQTEEETAQKEEEEEELDPLPGKRVYDPETQTMVTVEETPVESMDTIKWEEIPIDSIPPIESGTEMRKEEEEAGNPSELVERGDYGTEFYTSYNVVVMLPFLSQRFNPNSSEIYNNSLWALNYYGGLEMALDELGGEGVKLNVTVMDSKASTREVSRLKNTRPELFKAHMIIGNYRRENVQILANFARQNDITYVSPHSASSRIANSNPNYVQVSPTLKTHCELITQHALEQFDRKQLVLVARDKPAETARFNYFQEVNHRIENNFEDSVRLQEYVVEEQSADFRNIDLNPYITEGDTTVFIVPSWSNETFVYALLSQAKLVQSNTPDSYVAFYGMPQWQQYERIDLNLYERLNVHISSDTYLDPYDTEVQLFRRRFFNRYGSPPRDEAYLGYDVMRYFGRMINKHGTKFQYLLQQEPASALHTRFEFERVVKPRDGQTENLPIERFENKFVNILKFEDYQFQVVN